MDKNGYSPFTMNGRYSIPHMTPSSKPPSNYSFDDDYVNAPSSAFNICRVASNDQLHASPNKFIIEARNSNLLRSNHKINSCNNNLDPSSNPDVSNNSPHSSNSALFNSRLLRNFSNLYDVDPPEAPSALSNDNLQAENPTNNPKNGICLLPVPGTLLPLGLNSSTNLGVVSNVSNSTTNPKSWALKLSLNLCFQSENFRSFAALISEYKKSISSSSIAPNNPCIDSGKNKKNGMSHSSPLDQHKCADARCYANHNCSASCGSSIFPLQEKCHQMLHGGVRKGALIYGNVSDCMGRAARKIETNQGFISARQFATSRPQLSFVLAVTSFFLLLPLTTFLSFVIGSFCVTFFGFVLIEGTLLSIATMIALSVVMVLGGMGLFFSLFLLSAFVITSKLLNFFRLSVIPQSRCRAQSLYKSIHSLSGGTCPFANHNILGFSGDANNTAVKEINDPSNNNELGSEKNNVYHINSSSHRHIRPAGGPATTNF